MNLNSALRKPNRFLLAPFNIRNYRTLINIFIKIESPLSFLLMYLNFTSSFPKIIRIKSASEKVALKCYNQHDILTVAEIFCREDYRTKTKKNVVVDIGSNIGVSTLFFLTQNPNSKVYAFEPSRSNYVKLLGNTKHFTSRIVYSPLAVDVVDQNRVFREDSTGRYSGFADISNRPTKEEYLVKCISIKNLLEQVIDIEGSIDILKIDTEGNEQELVDSIAEHHRSKIEVIIYESNSYFGGIHKLTRKY